MGERTFQRIAACVKSPRLNKGRNFKGALTAATTAPKRREVTRREGRRRPHQYLVSHVQGFYLKCNESLRGGLGGEVTHANSSQVRSVLLGSNGRTIISSDTDKNGIWDRKIGYGTEIQDSHMCTGYLVT